MPEKPLVDPYRAMNPEHLVHSALTCPPSGKAWNLKSSHCPLAPPRNNLSILSYDNSRSAALWADHRWNAECFENTTRLRTFIPDIGTHPSGKALPRTAWVQLNRLRTGVGRFHPCLHMVWRDCPFCSLRVWCRGTSRWPCCPSLSNPSTSLWSAWPDPPGWWNNRIAAQQYPDYSHLVKLQPGQLPHKTTAT